MACKAQDSSHSKYYPAPNVSGAEAKEFWAVYWEWGSGAFMSYLWEYELELHSVNQKGSVWSN